MQTLANSQETIMQGDAGAFLPFHIDGDTEAKDIYNPSIPFKIGDSNFILARVEDAGKESDSEVCLFDVNSHYGLVSRATIKNMQDPYHMGQFIVDGKLASVFGGVKINVDSAGEIASYGDIWYTCPTELGHPLLGETLQDCTELDIVVNGIERWKDTRAIQLHDRVAVFPRPQGDFGGNGSIGYFESATLQDVTDDLLTYAKRADESTLLKGIFKPKEWGGVNQILDYNYSDGTFRLIGHRARWVVRDGARVRDYEAVYFEYNRYTKVVANIGVIATADDFVPISPKKLEGKESTLGKVVFPAGVSNGVLYAGVGDRRISNKHLPFL